MRISLCIFSLIGLFALGLSAQGQSLRDKVGELLILPYPVTQSAGGVILFARDFENFSSAEQVRQFISSLQQNRPHPLFVTIDQEGGVVQRLYEMHGFSKIPHPRFLGDLDDDMLIYRTYQILASELAAVGIHAPFAPTLDLHLDDNPIIARYRRAFSENPGTIGRVARIAADAFLSQGLLPTFKHFPGHGLTTDDSHHSLTPLRRTESQIFNEELAPYRYVFDKVNGPTSVMIGHLSFPLIPELGELPASLNPTVIQVWLRQRLGYDGLVITDSLEMKAIPILLKARGVAEEDIVFESTRLALLAGNDNIILGKLSLADQKVLIERLAKAAEKDPVLLERIEESYLRSLRNKKQFVIGRATSPLSDSLSTPGKVEVLGRVLKESSCPLTYNQLSQNRERVGE